MFEEGIRMDDAQDPQSKYGNNQLKSKEDWARFWFSKLAKHHRVHDPAKWSFTAEDVIA